MDRDTARDRALGALVGLAVGDAVGTTLEFKTPGTFEPITDMVGGGPFNLRVGEWTDDTTMAMCLGESLIDVGEFDAHDQLRRYQLWRDEGYWSVTGKCFDIGGTTSMAIERFARDGSITPRVIDQEAAANGSLMRLAPVPIRWHHDIEQAAAMSAASSRTTHPADRPVDACRVYGAMIAALIQGIDFDEVIRPDFWSFGPLDQAIADVIDGSWSQKDSSEIQGTGYVVDALEAAIWAVAGATEFSEAVLRAANLGNDADTTAAIAGQLAGARWGLSGIPKHWNEQLVHGERITSVASKLYDDALGADAPSRESWRFDQLVHAYWADPGVLLAGEYPGDADNDTARQKINVLIDQGVRTFVDLTEDHELNHYDGIIAEARNTRGVDVVHVRHPIQDFNVIDQDGYSNILTTIASRAGIGAAYVHCWGGIGRTGTVVGCYFVDSGMEGQVALDQIMMLRESSRKARIRSPESWDQKNIVRDRRQYLDAAK